MIERLLKITRTADIINIWDQQATGVNGPSLTNGAYRTLQFNQVSSNMTGLAWSANQLQGLQNGFYNAQIAMATLLTPGDVRGVGKIVGSVSGDLGVLTYSPFFSSDINNRFYDGSTYRQLYNIHGSFDKTVDEDIEFQWYPNTTLTAMTAYAPGTEDNIYNQGVLVRL